MNITTNPQTHITRQTNKQHTTQHTTQRTTKITTNNTNSKTNHNDNNPQITTRAGIPMPSAAHQRRGGVRHAA